MDQDLKEKQRKSYTLMRTTYDIVMAVLILGMAVLMFWGDKMRIMQIATLDPLIRYMFGGLCLLYGGFRLYRGIKQEY
jgi:uncharacterized membrane protein